MDSHLTANQEFILKVMDQLKGLISIVLPAIMGWLAPSPLRRKDPPQ